METYALPHLPLAYSTIHIALFHNVTNAYSIRNRLVEASTASGPEGDRLRAEVDYCFLDASVLVSRAHLLSTILSTLLILVPPSTPSNPHPAALTRTHNIHSELVLALYPSNNIAEAMRRLGVGEASTTLVLVKIGSADEDEAEVWRGMERVVQGKLVSLSELDKGTDWAKVDKVYKLAELNQLQLDPELLRHRKESAIINTIAVKSVT